MKFTAYFFTFFIFVIVVFVVFLSGLNLISVNITFLGFLHFSPLCCNSLQLSAFVCWYYICFNAHGVSAFLCVCVCLCECIYMYACLCKTYTFSKLGYANCFFICSFTRSFILLSSFLHAFVSSLRWLLSRGFSVGRLSVYLQIFHSFEQK